MKYNGRIYELPAEFTAELGELKPYKTYWAIFWIWVAITALGYLASWLREVGWFWPLYPLLGFAMAGRQGGLLQIIHEGSHKLVSHGRALNNFIANTFAGLPVGITLAGYTTGHMRHHAYTNTPDDLPTDLEKHAATSFKSRELYLRFAYDIFGVTALRSFFGHNQRKGPESTAPDPSQLKGKLDRLVKMGIVQVILFATVFRMDPFIYFFMWAIPIATFNMVLLRIRGIAEHGLPNQLGVEITSADQGNFYTRSMVGISWIEKLLIGSLSAGYHHEHHIFPNIPFYNLARLSERIAPEVTKRGPMVYVRGYFSAAIFNPKRFL